MKMRKLIALIAALCMVVGLVAGCEMEGQSSAPVNNQQPQSGGQTAIKDLKDVVIGWSMNTLSNPWRETMVTRAQECADEAGVKLIVLNADGKPEKQQSDLEDLVSQGVDVIVIDVCDKTACRAGVEWTINQGIPVIAVDTSIDETLAVTSFITADNQTIGYNVGYAMAEAWNSKETPDIAMISGSIGDYEGFQRRSGFITGFMEYQYEKFGGGGINVLAQRYGQWDAETGVRQMQDLMVQFPTEIDMVFSETDVVTVPSVDAIKAVGYDIKFVGSVDGQREALEMIKSGDIVAVGVNSALQMAEVGIDYAIKTAQGQTVPAKTFVDSPAITKSNVDQYYDENLPFL